MFYAFRDNFSQEYCPRYKIVDNPALVVSFGILIAKGILRKENAREILIEIGIFKSIDASKQCLIPLLADEVIRLTKDWKSPNDAIYKMTGAWWMEEATLRCSIIAAFFTQQEQLSILDILQKTPTRPPLDCPT